MKDKCKNCTKREELIESAINMKFRKMQYIIDICKSCSEGGFAHVISSEYTKTRAVLCDNKCYLYSHRLCQTETKDGLCDRENRPLNEKEEAGKRIRFP